MYMASGKIEKTKLIFKEYSGTLSTELYEGYYWTSILSDLPVSKLVGLYVAGTYQNKMAFCQLIGEYIRVWGSSPGISVQIRAAYQV